MSRDKISLVSLCSNYQYLLPLDDLVKPPLHKLKQPKSKWYVAFMPNFWLNALLLGPNNQFSTKCYTNRLHGQNNKLLKRIASLRQTLTVYIKTVCCFNTKLMAKSATFRSKLSV